MRIQHLPVGSSNQLRAEGSFSRHRLSARNASLHLLTHLDYRAKRAAEVGYYIAHQRTVDSLQLPESLSVKSAEDDQRKSKEGGQAAQEAAFTESLGIFAKGVAGNDEGDDAKAAVVEAAAKSALPVRHF